MKNLNLFEDSNDIKQAPLASRMRPQTLDEIVGQQHIIGKDKLLYRAIKADRLESIILYGPPGIGKTTIAKVIANTTHSYFCKLNATNAGFKKCEGIEYRLFNMDYYILTYSKLDKKISNEELKQTIENIYDGLFPKKNLIINMEEDIQKRNLDF